MPLYGSVGPPTGAPPLPGDPFLNFPNAGIDMSRNPDGTYLARFVPDISHPERIYTFESGAVGSHVTQEQIWAFKLRVLAADIDLMFGLIADMQATVPPGKIQWAAGVKQFVTAIVNLQNVSGTLCDETASPTTSQPPKT